MTIFTPHHAEFLRVLADRIRYAFGFGKPLEQVTGLVAAARLRETDSLVPASGYDPAPASSTSSASSAPLKMRSQLSSAGVAPDKAAPCTGVLIINADDWGRDRHNTERILECVRRKTVSSVSAMVFMEDSERAAALAREAGIDVGLHLNFTAPFSATNCPAQLLEKQRQLSNHLLRHRYAQVIFHPGLAGAFEYVVEAQLDEFRRLYGAAPERFDGHHHMHLCANVLYGKLLPAGTIVRRNFSFRPGEKSVINRLYRSFGDRMLARRHRCVDFFFALDSLETSGRLQRIFSLAHQYVVELETHPIDPREYEFLMGNEIFRQAAGLQISPRYTVS